MASRALPTKVVHFTHINNLRTVVQQGLLCDTVAQRSGTLAKEVGNLSIKDRRRDRTVPLPPGGSVADYVPFYFAPRSPMMYSIARGNVASYREGTGQLLYLVSSLEALHEQGHQITLTDRNASLRYVAYRAFDLADPIDDNFIDWKLMKDRYWNDTDEDPTRVERRMAEALVYEQVTWNAITEVVAQNDNAAREASSILTTNHSTVPVNVRPQWYF